MSDRDDIINIRVAAAVKAISAEPLSAVDVMTVAVSVFAHVVAACIAPEHDDVALDYFFAQAKRSLPAIRLANTPAASRA